MAQITTFDPPRPTINDDIRRRAAEAFAVDYGHIGLECKGSDDIIDDLVCAMGHTGDMPDGYELAKYLDDYRAWVIDFDAIETLNCLCEFLDEEMFAAEEAWARENNILPLLPVGTVVFYGSVFNRKKGVITGIYKYRPACYEVKENGAEDNRRIIVKYEDAQTE